MTVEELEKKEDLFVEDSKAVAFEFFNRNAEKLDKLKKTEFARSLGVSRQAVYNWLKEYKNLTK